MVAVPTDTPVTTPEVLTVATDVAELLHVPPKPPETDNVEVEPAHIELTPVIVPGLELTVTIIIVEQPVGKVYVIAVVPIDVPVTIPVANPTVAIAGFEDTHTPPAGLDDKVEDTPVHIKGLPVIEVGKGFTVTTAVAISTPSVYVIVAVPGLTPVVIPVAAPINAIDTSLLDHVPPTTGLDNVVTLPSHTLSVPVMGGSAA
jgi:hypothetical protein